MTTDSPLVSIIIPVHNAESFLDECFKSVIGQTYKHIEIITVDDDSTDGSKDIIKKYQDKDARIKYFKVDMHNAAQTRRKGVEIASAEIVCFADADDILHEKYVEILYDAMRQKDVKIATGKIASITTGSDIKDIPDGTQKVQTETDLLAYFGSNYRSSEKYRHIAQSINAKIFAKELFDHIDYSVLKTSILEDNYIIAQLLKSVKPQKIALVDTTLYYYRQNHHSTMGLALSHMIKFGDKEITYPQLFEKTMDYIGGLYGKSKDIQFYINKIKAEEYYSLAQVVVDRNIRVIDQEKLIEDMKLHIDELEALQAKLNKKITDLLDSRSYKVGRAITYPIRKLKK